MITYIHKHTRASIDNILLDAAFIMDEACQEPLLKMNHFWSMT